MVLDVISKLPASNEWEQLIFDVGAVNSAGGPRSTL